MKRKLIPSLLALVLGVSAFGACTNSDQKVDFSNYWNENPLVAEEIHESLVYDVTFKANDTNLVDYKLDYKDGKYTTELTSKVENDKLVYTYATTLTITAIYTLGEATQESTDTVTSTVKFYEAGYGLQPISSTKEINASTPTPAANGEIDACYQKSHYTTSVSYNENCTEGKAVVTYYPEGDVEKVYENTFEIEQKKFSYLDNEQLLLALRAVRNSTSSAKLNVYSPFIETVQKVSWSFESEASAPFTFTKNDEAINPTITYRVAKMVLDEKNPGATQTVWIAKKPETSSDKNTHRNLMLRLETPLSYSLGSLVYTLNSVSYNK